MIFEREKETISLIGKVRILSGHVIFEMVENVTLSILKLVRKSELKQRKNQKLIIEGISEEFGFSFTQVY